MGEREGGAVGEDQFRELRNVVLKKECFALLPIPTALHYYYYDRSGIYVISISSWQKYGAVFFFPASCAWYYSGSRVCVPPYLDG